MSDAKSAHEQPSCLYRGPIRQSGIPFIARAQISVTNTCSSPCVPAACHSLTHLPLGFVYINPPPPPPLDLFFFSSSTLFCHLAQIKSIQFFLSLIAERHPTGCHKTMTNFWTRPWERWAPLIFQGKVSPLLHCRGLTRKQSFFSLNGWSGTGLRRRVFWCFGLQQRKLILVDGPWCLALALPSAGRPLAVVLRLCATAAAAALELETVVFLRARGRDRDVCCGVVLVAAALKLPPRPALSSHVRTTAAQFASRTHF